MSTFNVHAAWLADAEVTADAVLKVNQTFRPDDELLCTWVDHAEPRRFIVSFDIEAADYATAARECLTTVAQVTQIERRMGTLEEVGASDDEGFIVVAAEDFAELRNVAH